jgi:hypothetical protein
MILDLRMMEANFANSGCSTAFLRILFSSIFAESKSDD